MTATTIVCLDKHKLILEIYSMMTSLFIVRRTAFPMAREKD